MTRKRIGLLSFIITLIIWAWFSWPLPRYFTAGIPSSAHIEPADVQTMVPGDHLQFMYYCWLAGDMVFGKTPLFCNPYEFNTGKEKSEAARTLNGISVAEPSVAKQGFRAKEGGYRPDTYYLPFSLIYSVTALAGQSAGFGLVATDGRAFGWNFTGFISLWLTFLLTWLLVRRYCGDDWLATRSAWPAACASIIAITLPFRWINLCGGSPAGWAMMWIPAIFLGIDLAVRDGKYAGGMLAGFSLLFASWTDSHIFFFGALASSFWAVIAAAAGLNGDRKWQDSWQKIFAALLPIPLFLGIALAFPDLLQMFAGKTSAGQYLASSVGARLWREIALYSPNADGFLAWFSSGASSHIYIGVAILALMAAGTACLIIDGFRRWNESSRRLIVMLLLLAGMAGIMALALGTNGPFHAIFLRICRKIIPPYAMIRQPAKIFCLMPSFLAVAAGISLSAVLVHLRSSKAKAVVILLFCAAMTTEYVLRVNTTVSLLDSKQGAYEAVANAAAAEGKAPHALVVPLWPGDSHYSSVYQHYASLYRIRMVNGYNPFVSKTYRDKVFFPFESVNQGWLTDKQIDELLRRKIEYLILHEDLFPEKVSPFPVGLTLKRFLAHERLKFIGQDGRVWTFKILAEPEERTKSKADGWTKFACARHWQAENSIAGQTPFIRGSAPFHVSYAVLNAPGMQVFVPGQRLAPTPQTRWMLRARGNGAVLAETIADGKTISRDLIDIQSDDWEWVDVPLDDFDHFAPCALKIEHESGSVDCDQILLSADEWLPPYPHQTFDLPAPGMFHAGYTSLADNTVVLEKGREAKALIFYGPKLPLEKGRYRIELVFSSDSPRGILLGQFNVKRGEHDHTLNWVPVISGARSLTEFTQLQNVPMYLEFSFLGNGNLKISGIKLARLE